MNMRAVAWIVLALPCLAQQSIQNASVSGRVTDSSGGVVEGASVQARQIETRMLSASETDAEGRFRFPSLHVGAYEITVRKLGFADFVQRITLSAGSAFELPVALSVKTETLNVVVSAEAATIETARSQIAATVQQSEIAKMPLNGRNFLDLALLVPGVSPTNTASTQLFPETSAVAGQGISINSQRNFSNSFIVDGLSANDDAAGLSGIPYGVDAVTEFQVVTSGGQAEFGRALGGYVNVVTKSGTNAFHADLYSYLRDQRMNARNVLSGSKLPYTQVQYGASAGGPVVKDRTFFFGNFEQRSLNQSGLVTISPANIAAINARLGTQLTTGLYSNPVDSTHVLAKVDHQISTSDTLAVRYSAYKVTSANSRGVGALNAVSAAAGLDNGDHNIAVSNVWTISPRVVNETRGQYSFGDLKAEPNDPNGPTVTISGVATFGRLAGSPTGRRNHLGELTDSLSIQTGAHAIRFGTDFLYNSTMITYPRTIRGAYTFSSLNNFLNGVYNNAGFTQTFGDPISGQSNPNLGLYVQDEWKIRSRLTINAGLRYDLQFLDSINTDKNNVSPRIGLTWAPFASRKTVVRGSYGLFYDRVPLRAVANALLSSGQTVVSLSPNQASAPVFPNILAALPTGIVPNITAMDKHMQNAYSVQASAEVEQQIGNRTTLSAGYQHVRGLRLIASINQNVPACVASGNNNGCRPDPRYGNISQYSPRGDSQYDGLHVSLVQRMSKWGSYRVSYTYSKAMNNVGEFFFSSPIDNYNLWQDWARSDDDQRHRLVMNGTVRVPRLFELSGTLQSYSALPFNITTGTTTIQGTTARPIVNGSYISRNAGEGFDRFQLNLRASRSIRLSERFRVEAIAEMFNVTNRVNGVTLNSTFGSGAYPASPLPSFRQVTSVGEPRSGQIALRLSF